MQKFYKKVLHLRSTGEMLGAENVVLEIAKHSRAMGYISIVGVLQDTRDMEAELFNVANENGLQTAIFTCSGRIDLTCVKKIKQFVVSSDVDLLHCHGYKEDAYGLLSQLSIPKIATNHLWKTNTFMLRFYRIIDSFLLRKFDRVVGVSEEIVTEMMRLCINKSMKITNGIDLNWFTAAPKSERLLREFGLRRDAVIFGMISSLTTEKNHILAIESFEKLSNKNTQLLIVGDGPLFDELKERVSSLNLRERVFFVGRQNNIRDILSVMDVFLLPSLQEGLPMALLEAMACGKAVIASGVGEIPNVIVNKVSGFVVAPSDSVALVDAMQRLVGNVKLINEVGIKARQRVEKHFSSEQMTRQYCRLYDQVLASNAKVNQRDLP